MEQPSPSRLRYSRPKRAGATDDPATPSPRKLRRDYDANFAVTPDYQASLPDLMGGKNADGRRAPVLIQQVGIAGFRLPLRFATAANSPTAGAGKNGRARKKAIATRDHPGVVTLETRVTGTVTLPAALRAINMSRIIRTFYEFEEATFTIDALPQILARFRETIGGPAARLRLDFSFPLLQPSLRSGLAGYQYYEAGFEAELRGKTVRRWLRFDFVYSSACPCSSELAEHARTSRGIYAIPHSQRSRARVWAEVAPGASLAIEDLQAACLRALQTETQVMVRRPDEQAFAEMNGAHVKFVEDAARMLYRELVDDRRIADFQIACSHLESLHSHDAVAVVCKGVAGGFRGEFTDFAALAG